MHADKLSFDRIVFFSDAVFAIAITILVLEIKVPEVHGHPSDAELRQMLLELLPRIMGFLISFFVIGSLWRGHHRAFGMLASWDQKLISLNLALLAAISFIPFPTGFFSAFPYSRTGMILYGVTLLVAGTLQAVLWRYATRGPLLRPGVGSLDLIAGNRRTLVLPSVALLSIALCTINSGLGGIAYMLIPISFILLGWRNRRAAAAAALAAAPPPAPAG